MEAADVVVVGGGVMGCSLAYHLASRGIDVLLLERDQLGSGSTGKNAGGVRQQFSNEINVRIQMRAVKMLKDFEAELGAPAAFRQIGYLFVLTQPQEAIDFRSLVEMWHRLGLTEARWLEPEQARQLVPGLGVEDVLGCTFCPSDGIASPDSVTQGYAAAARRLGARLREGTSVTGVEVSKGRLTGVATSAGEISTRVLFNCAGPWSKALGEMAGVKVPVEPHKRHIWVTGPVPGLEPDCPMTVDFATTFYFHPEGEGLLFGIGERQGEQPDAPTFSTAVDDRALERAIDVALRRLPALGQAGVKTGWAGLYEVTPDHQAILGPSREVEGFWCACGFSGHGFMQAPAAGLLLAQLLVDGKSEIDLSALSPDRFAAGALLAEKNVI